MRRGRRSVVVVMAVSLAGGGCGDGGDEGAQPRVGESCVPEDEQDAAFPGLRLGDEDADAASDACGGGLCLANHFQGRVSCPYGQPEPKLCKDDGDCGGLGAGVRCLDAQGTAVCSPGSGDPSADFETLGARHCYVPGTKTPVAAPVCSQCSARPAERAVYCSCRCGPSSEVPSDDAGDFCSCPDGFVCAELSAGALAGGKSLVGKYCVRAGTEYADQGGAECGAVLGHWGPECQGTPPLP
jgi:hypothetical protein